MASKKSIAAASLEFTGLFEAELLLELMLRYWQHPLAGDRDFRCSLLEQAASVLQAAVDGMQLFDEIAAENTTLVAALWYVESMELQQETGEKVVARDQRKQWLDRVRQALPSCFCNPDDLTE